MGFIRPCWKKERPVETERRVRANDPEYNAQFKYKDNYISTSKYNILTFIPINLFEQFQRLANAYFLFLLILQCIPQVTSLSPVTTVVPLAVVLGITALKDIVDDVQRHRSDNQINGRISSVLRDGQIVDARWQTVVVGDIIRMENNQFVAADLLLLSSSEPNSLCYIETAELDGETNLKVRQALTETAAMGADNHAFSAFKGEVVCEKPNNNLSKFEGRLTWDGKDYSLDNDKVLLRGCVLRNTEWCYGLVLFAGPDTKLMMNSGKTTFKRTHIDALMNLLIIGLWRICIELRVKSWIHSSEVIGNSSVIFCFLVFMCLICALGCGLWEAYVGNTFQIYLPWESHVPTSSLQSGVAVIAVLQFFSYIIVLNTVVPISLYVSVEMIRFGHSWWINWDSKMYYEKKDTAARARTTTLNEQLGQIEYIFSDKTGTLTQNIMTFNKCSIQGKAYGDIYDERGQPMDITENTPKVDFSKSKYYEPTFDFYDGSLLHAVEQNDENAHEFFRLLALCHTVMASEKEGTLEYQAQSPDEAALVGAARNFGFAFKSRTPNSITIDARGVEETYELLCILDFNNVRKRMSVVLRRDDRIILYCKGADSTIYERLDPRCASTREATTLHLETFAQDGLRTLCCAYKEIDPAFFEGWRVKHHAASISLENRDDKLSDVYEEIEAGMMLIGATAIEDKLQDGVPDAIANLARAGIKIWVLTGDKQETAINIGYSCKLLTDEMEEIFVIDADEYVSVQTQLTEAKQGIKGKLSNTLIGPGIVNNAFSDVLSNGLKTSQKKRDPTFAIIINGHSLTHALDKSMENLLAEVGCMCKAVICCRVTPLQKAQVVELIKRYKKTITLSIGDGANDVSMIKVAHIGVGISGQEGMQAVLASDYSMAQFAYLERLLLVHGRWSYLRMCKFLKYFFYKNFAFTLCHFWFAFFCGFSAQTLYDQSFITIYNVIYTSTPVLVMGFLDQDVNDEYSLRYPKLYAPGHLDLLFNKKVFAQSVAEGIITSLILFFIPYSIFQEAVQPSGVDMSGHQAYGTVIATTLVIVVTLRCGLETSYWTPINHLFIWGSIVVYFAITLIMYTGTFGYTYVGVAENIMSQGNFWFTILLCVVILLIPIVTERFYYCDTRPTLTDKVRLKQRRDMKPKPKPHAVSVIRRGSSMRHSQRSVGKTGYAFSHQQGFAELITSGSMMATVSTPAIRSEPTLTKVATDVPDYAQTDNIEPAANGHSSSEVAASIDVQPYDSVSSAEDESIHKAEVHVRSPVSV